MASFFILVLLVLFLAASVFYGKLRYGAPPAEVTDADFVALVRAGKTRKAVRWYRLRYGVGLTAARRGVNRLVQNA